jgi:hypothetical protein
MIRFSLLTTMLSLVSLTSFAQCVVALDAKKRITTTCQLPSSNLNRPIKLSRFQEVYLGSEYISFPIWQNGTLVLGDSHHEISCKIAYNLATQEVRCRFDSNSTEEKLALPNKFTINGVSFLKQSDHALGAKSIFYAMVLYDGQTKLLKKIQHKLKLTEPIDGYAKAEEFNGYYEVFSNYYLLKADGALVPISLNKKDILAALNNDSERLASQMPSKKVSVDDLIKALSYYDVQLK